MVKYENDLCYFVFVCVWQIKTYLIYSAYVRTYMHTNKPTLPVNLYPLLGLCRYDDHSVCVCMSVI